MQIKEVTYERLVNLGNYENERFALTVSATSQGQDTTSLFDFARREVNAQVEGAKKERVRKIR